MDIVSAICPHTPATYHLLSARCLKLLKRDTYIVNIRTFVDGNTLPDRVLGDVI
jgi:hypothetical protein